MIFHYLSLAALLHFAVATDSAAPTVTGQYDFTQVSEDPTAYYEGLTSAGLKPSAASYWLTVAYSNTAVAAAFSAWEQITDHDIDITGSFASVLATQTGTLNIVQAIQYQEAQITDVPSQYRGVLSSVLNEELALQTGAAAPRQTDLALSAAVAGAVGIAAGLAVAL